MKIALYEPQIPPNTGNISRLAVGLDLELILIGKLGFKLDNKYVKRAGLDYWQYLKLSICHNYEDFLTKFKSRIVFVTTKGKHPYYKYCFSSEDILLFGSENGGCPEKYLVENIENTVTIPIIGKVRSLNLSNSVALVTYHALLQTGFFDKFDCNKKYYDLVERYDI